MLLQTEKIQKINQVNILHDKRKIYQNNQILLLMIFTVIFQVFLHLPSLIFWPEEESTSDTPESAGEGGNDPAKKKIEITKKSPSKFKIKNN